MDCLMLQGGYPPWLLYENSNIKLRTNDSSKCLFFYATVRGSKRLSKIYNRLQLYTLFYYELPGYRYIVTYKYLYNQLRSCSACGLHSSSLCPNQNPRHTRKLGRNGVRSHQQRNVVMGGWYARKGVYVPRGGMAGGKLKRESV